MNNLARIDQIIAEIKQSMAKPGCRTLTSLQMEHRADRLREYATGVKLNGGSVKPEYNYERD